MDGSDVFEATSIQIHIEELRAKCVCLALDENQKEVINGLTVSTNAYLISFI